MKTFKRIFTALFIVSLLALLFRGPLYRFSVAYQSIGPRTNYPATGLQLLQHLEQNASFSDVPTTKDIIHRALSITSEKLHFTGVAYAIDPNRVIHTRTAHCIGYAAFFATTCNYLFEKNGLENTWIAEPQKGQLYLFGQNVHPYISTPFFKDHDFVIILNKVTGEVMAVDPTVDDYLGIGRVAIR